MRRSKTSDGYTLVTCHLTAYIQLDQVDLNQAIQQINIEGENRELKAVIAGLKQSQGKAGELPYGTTYFQKFAQNSALLKKVCDVGYDVDSVSYDKATGLIRYNRFTRAVDDDQLYAFHVELSYPDNTERIYKITKITEKPFQATELKFKNTRETMLPLPPTPRTTTTAASSASSCSFPNTRTSNSRAGDRSLCSTRRSTPTSST